MIKDRQVILLRETMEKYKNQKIAAAKSGMSERSARKYLKEEELPSSLKKEREWRTRTSDIEEVWSEAEALLRRAPKLNAPMILSHLKEKHPEKIMQAHLRSLQRRMQQWRSLEGPDQEVIFPQDIKPGRQSQSDYTHMDSLGITIQGMSFPHLLYHFMMPYSRWEDVRICFTESFETLTEGYEQAVWKLGKVAPEHRTDNQSAVATVMKGKSHFTQRWKEFMAHYDVTPSCNNPGKGHENGSVEKSHDLLKKAVEQHLFLRGSKDFESQEAYGAFVQEIVDKRNKERQEEVLKERDLLKDLPPREYLAPEMTMVRVSSSSMVTIRKCTYSVPSRLIHYSLKACIYSSKIDLYYGRQLVQTMKRGAREESHVVDYKHIIHALIKKPGAFEQYKYRESLFPRLIFRKAYDYYKRTYPRRGHKVYLNLLQLAALHGESTVARVLENNLEQGVFLEGEALKEKILFQAPKKVPTINILAPQLKDYNLLLFRTGEYQEVRA
jgi:hypothetical protein